LGRRGFWQRRPFLLRAAQGPKGEAKARKAKAEAEKAERLSDLGKDVSAAA